MRTPEAAQHFSPDSLAGFLPPELRGLAVSQTLIPSIAKDAKLITVIENAVRHVPTRHDLHHADARAMDFLARESVQLVVTSPPYWVLKEYHVTDG